MAIIGAIGGDGAAFHRAGWLPATVLGLYWGTVDGDGSSNGFGPDRAYPHTFREKDNNVKKTLGALAVAGVLAGGLTTIAVFGQGRGQQGPPQPMGFFVTSVGLGDGANLGGLAGADKHCQALAAAVGAGGRTWHAYLSAAAADGQPAVNARDRIGNGPWYNAKSQLIAQNVADLHGDVERDRNNIRKPTALNEKGEQVNGAGDNPNIHDILTGSNSHGRLPDGATAADATCGNWTSNGAGRTLVGHHDRLGGANSSWNSVHPTQGCSQQQLVATGGAGLFYCFAE